MFSNLNQIYQKPQKYHLIVEFYLLKAKMFDSCDKILRLDDIFTEIPLFRILFCIRICHFFCRFPLFFCRTCVSSWFWCMSVIFMGIDHDYYFRK